MNIDTIALIVMFLMLLGLVFVVGVGLSGSEKDSTEDDNRSRRSSE